MKILWTIIAVFICTCLTAQKTYDPVKSGGEIPSEFVTLSSEKYKEAVNDLEYTTSKDQSDRKEFLLQSSFSIDEVLQGGQVLFNESITDYVNAVAGEIYLANPSLPSDLRFYVTRSTTTNAFSTNQGVIFITTGLIAQLENEAQLAFILCHEISHYIKEHTIQSFLESKQSIRNNKSLRTIDDYIALMSKYSKSQEFEADEEGFEYYSNTGYDLNEAITAFDVLHYSYLPFDEIPFDLNFLLEEEFQLRPELKLDSINEIDVFNEDYDDDKSSHPNIWKRKQKVKEHLLKIANNSSEWFIVGKEAFDENQLLCRKEGVRIHLLQGEYTEAVYASFLISQEYPDDEFLQISTAKAIYGLQQHDAYGELNKVLASTKRVEGEAPRLVHFLNELEEEELAVLAILKLYKLSNKYPDNEYYFSLYEDCLRDMVMEQEIVIDDFETQTYQELMEAQESSRLAAINAEQEKEINDVSGESESEEHQETRQRSGKYSRIEEAKVVEVMVDSIGEVVQMDYIENGYTYALAVMLRDTAFANMFQELSDEYEAEIEAEESISSSQKWALKRAEAKRKAKRNKKLMREGTSLGLSDVTIYDPSVANYNLSGYNYMISESDEIYFTNQLQNYASDKNYNVMSYKGSGDVDTDMYNHMSRLSAWSFESYRLEQLEVEIIPSESEYIADLQEFTGSRYLVLTDVTTSLEKRDIHAGIWFYSILFFPTLPVTAAVALNRKKHYIHGLKVYDLETGTLIHRSYREMKTRGPKRGLDAVAYDTIQQLSRTRKN